MTILECDIPSASVLDGKLIATAYFHDSYHTPLNRREAGVVQIFHGIFGYHPRWMKILLIVRNQVASCCGLEAPKASEIIHFVAKNSYVVGDKIGVWPILSLSDTELVAGRDNSHLDFRLSPEGVGRQNSEPGRVHRLYGAQRVWKGLSVCNRSSS